MSGVALAGRATHLTLPAGPEITETVAGAIACAAVVHLKDAVCDSEDAPRDGPDDVTTEPHDPTTVEEGCEATVAAPSLDVH